MMETMAQRIQRAIDERNTDKLPALGLTSHTPITHDLCGRVNHLILSTTTSVALTFRMQQPKYHEFRMLYIQPSNNIGFYIAKCSNFGELAYVEIGSGCSIDLEFIECNPVKNAAIVRINALIDPRWSNCKLFYKHVDYQFPLRVHNIRRTTDNETIQLEVNDIVEGTFPMVVQSYMLRLDLRFA